MILASVVAGGVILDVSTWRRFTNPKSETEEGNTIEELSVSFLDEWVDVFWDFGKLFLNEPQN